MNSLRPKLKILGIIIPLIFFLDQVTKHLIVAHLPLGGFIPVIPGIFDIVHTRNRGAAFGFMANLPDSLRLPFFLTVSFFTLVLITVYFFRLHPRDQRKSVFICLALVIGGALGNIWDRITLGEVIDFLSFHWYEGYAHWTFFGHPLAFKLEWPAFNVADSAISIAVTWMIVSMLKRGE